jgi:hypothetical protein
VFLTLSLLHFRPTKIPFWILDLTLPFSLPRDRSRHCRAPSGGQDRQGGDRAIRGSCSYWTCCQCGPFLDHPLPHCILVDACTPLSVSSHSNPSSIPHFSYSLLSRGTSSQERIVFGIEDFAFGSMVEGIPKCFLRVSYEDASSALGLSLYGINLFM